MTATRRFARQGVVVAMTSIAVVAALVAFAARKTVTIDVPSAGSLLHRDDGFVGAAVCGECHESEHRTWARTFHSTMTRLPDPASVVGIFDGRALDEGATRVVPRRDGSRFVMTISSEGVAPRDAEVALCVGSRRYQQYFERVGRGDGEAFERLPWLYSRVDREWIPVKDVFFHVDDVPLDASRVTWNANCIFCHNTAPRPGIRERALERPVAESRFDSRVGDLGIACESCHGPGRAHVESRDRSYERWSAQAFGSHAGDIVHPDRLSKERSLDVCGSCHGQRVPRPLSAIGEWMHAGPPYRSGADLSASVDLVDRSTPSPDPRVADLFSKRFWGDGTPRLSAYEYQGIKDSACHQKGELSCLSCHAMHGGDPEGMIEPAMRTDRACAGCHEAVAADVVAHSGHASEDASCYDCHMPRIVYGVLEIHRSHRIENPDPVRDAAAGRPDACTLCHWNRSPVWAEAEVAKREGRVPRVLRRLDGAPADVADGVASILAGDPVQRASYLKALATSNAKLDDADVLSARQLIAITAGDAYPNVRIFARRTLLALESRVSTGLGEMARAWRPIDAAARAATVSALIDGLDRHARAKALALPLSMDFIRRLLDLQSETAIEVGE